MSASEKLKTLGERAVADRYQTIDQLREKYGADWPAESAKAQSLVYAALSQIVAVVAAAEKPRFEVLVVGGTGEFCRLCERSVKRHHKNCPLPALEEALS